MFSFARLSDLDSPPAPLPDATWPALLTEPPFSLCFSLDTDLCLSNTVGQMDVGGRTWTLWAPNRHSGFTWAAQRLWYCRGKRSLC